MTSDIASLEREHAMLEHVHSFMYKFSWVTIARTTHVHHVVGIHVQSHTQKSQRKLARTLFIYICIYIYIYIYICAAF